MEPKLIDGGLAVDDRGQLQFFNAFSFDDVKRFYVVQNHKQGFVRAWHGHKKEAKYVTVLKGAAVIGAVAVDDWSNPSNELKAARYVLSEKKPQLLFIPSGYANGNMSLTDDAVLVFYSTSTLEESKGDDFRFDARLWDIWNIEER